MLNKLRLEIPKQWIVGYDIKTPKGGQSGRLAIRLLELEDTSLSVVQVSVR
jgi:hypothetical protein